MCFCFHFKDVFPYLYNTPTRLARTSLHDSSNHTKPTGPEKSKSFVAKFSFHEIDTNDETRIGIIPDIFSVTEDIHVRPLRVGMYVIYKVSLFYSIQRVCIYK